MQYTIRNIPSFLDRVLRRTARARGDSLNAVAVDALVRGLGLSHDSVPQRQLKDLAGTWADDPAFDAAIRAQDDIDERL